MITSIESNTDNDTLKMFIVLSIVKGYCVHSGKYESPEDFVEMQFWFHLRGEAWVDADITGSQTIHWIATF